VHRAIEPADDAMLLCWSGERDGRRDEELKQHLAADSAQINARLTP
jgi:hypothetical protein